jgi:tetratricopeptide (TPR) repeat protein
LQARKAIETRDFAGARDALESLLETDANHIEALDLLGFVYYFLNSPADAKVCCERVLAQKPDHAYAVSGLGTCLCALGQVDEGLAHYERAMQLAPKWVEPRHDMIVALVNAGRLEAAQKKYDEYVSEFPGQGLERLARAVRRQ